VRQVLACLFAILISHSAAAEVPAQRLATLSRGVNLIDVFSDKKPLPALLNDLTTIQRNGFRHVRFFLDPAWVWRPGEPQRLDQVLKAAFAAKLGVIICMQSYVKEFKDDPVVIDRWTTAWKQIAAHYAKSDPDRLFFELVNEPPGTDVPRWAAIQEALRRNVRAIVPHHTLLLTGAPTSTSSALATLPPSEDDNVAYVFHVYAPMIFSHQGADWADPAFGTVHGLQYPPNPDNIEAIRRRISPSRQADLTEYAKLGRGIITREIEVANGWGRKYNVPLVVTEFGVYRAAAPPQSRAAWLRDVRQTLEHDKIGWTIWEYNGGFGIKPELDLGCGDLPASLGLCH